MKGLSIFTLLFVCLISLCSVLKAVEPDSTGSQGKNQLAVLWTSGDPDVAHRVCFMYTHAAKKYNWFDEVLLIVWGPSSRLLAGDKDLQTKIKTMMDNGIKVDACIACANSYGVTDALKNLGIDVKPMGEPLTNILKNGWKVLTF